MMQGHVLTAVPRPSVPFPQVSSPEKPAEVIIHGQSTFLSFSLRHRWFIPNEAHSLSYLPKKSLKTLPQAEALGLKCPLRVPDAPFLWAAPLRKV